MKSIAISLSSFALALAGLTACSGQSSTTPAAAGAPQKSAATASAATSAAPASVLHAAAAVKPGSHDDWCGEHAVPESQCTRCNPDLVPAFKATNDWCAEHGLPESQCLKCNPNLKIVRPAPGAVP